MEKKTYLTDYRPFENREELHSLLCGSEGLNLPKQCRGERYSRTGKLRALAQPFLSLFIIFLFVPSKLLCNH
jgi:hypothetical protein